MESIYYVMTWLCHRKCVHCYDDRFRPYVRGALDKVVAESATNASRIIANLPDSMTYKDLEKPNADGSYPERPGRIILAGGEVLLDPIREAVLYPAIEQIALPRNRTDRRQISRHRRGSRRRADHRRPFDREDSR